jgi:hypothetical protein
MYEGVHNHLDWRTRQTATDPESRDSGNSRPVEQSAQAAPALISVATGQRPNEPAPGPLHDRWSGR